MLVYQILYFETLTNGYDLFKATSALVTLSQRRSRLVEMLASDILEKPRGDRYLQAVAINVLFDFNPPKAFEFVVKEIQICDLYIFNTILELMIDHLDYFSHVDKVWITEIAFKRLSALDNREKWPTLEVKERFFATYPAPHT